MWYRYTIMCFTNREENHKLHFNNITAFNLLHNYQPITSNYLLFKRVSALDDLIDTYHATYFFVIDAHVYFTIKYKIRNINFVIRIYTYIYSGHTQVRQFRINYYLVISLLCTCILFFITHLFFRYRKRIYISYVECHRY